MPLIEIVFNTCFLKISIRSFHCIWGHYNYNISYQIYYKIVSFNNKYIYFQLVLLISSSITKYIIFTIGKHFSHCMFIFRSFMKYLYINLLSKSNFSQWWAKSCIIKSVVGVHFKESFQTRNSTICVPPFFCWIFHWDFSDYFSSSVFIFL